MEIRADGLMVTSENGEIIGDWDLDELDMSWVKDGLRIEFEGEGLLFSPNDSHGFTQAARAYIADVAAGLDDPVSGSSDRADYPSKAEGYGGAAWWKFWNLTAWQEWRERRQVWREYQRERRRLDNEVAANEARLVETTSELGKAERGRLWAQEVSPRELPVKTARAETGLASVAAVSLLETRRREGRDEWTTVDQGDVHFTDRKLVFSGTKSVEFRYDKLRAASAVPQGLHLAVSSRKRDHILAGPVDRLQAMLLACQAVAGGASPTDPFDEEADWLRHEEVRVEGRIRDLGIERTSLIAPARPRSPGWIPAGVLALLVVFGSPFAASETSLGASTQPVATTAAVSDDTATPDDGETDSAVPPTTVREVSTTTTTSASPVAPVAPITTTTPPATTVSGEMVVWFFDVGQGDATLLQGPDFTILIDAGRHDRTDVVPHLRSAGVTSIDLLVGTHPHADHIGQFAQVLEAFPVTEVWMSGDSHTTLTFERALDAILASDAGYREPRAGESYRIGSSRIEVVNPSRVSGNLHDGSIALRVTFGQVSFMFTGDAETATEQAMVSRGHEMTSHVLQVGHHGSRTATSADFLRAVSPIVAVYSASVGNQYGHPHAEVIDRLTAAGAEVYGTATHETIRVTTNGSNLRVAPNRQGSAIAPPATSATTTTTASVTTTTAVSASGCGPGRVDINSAGFDELQLIIHIGPDRAQQILDLRPFSSVDSMTRISGIGPARLAEIKNEGIACVP